jgi:hypothetical protein
VILAAVAALASQAQPVTVATIDPKHRLIEGVASDGRTIWVSSVLDRTILACRKRCKPLAVLPEGLHPLGIAWDSSRKRLWIAADCPELPGIVKCERGALLAIDAKGNTKAHIEPSIGNFHIGDVSASGGQVFVSDSQNGAIYRLLPSGKALMALILPGAGKSGQGSVLDASAKTLVASDYSQGIATIDLATGKRTVLPRLADKPLLRGIDGLARCGNRHFGIYNGSAPGRIFALEISGNGVDYTDLVEGLRLPDPTQLAFDGKQLLVIGNAGWEAAAKGEPRSEGAPILAIPLDEVCGPR